MSSPAESTRAQIGQPDAAKVSRRSKYWRTRGGSIEMVIA